MVFDGDGLDACSEARMHLFNELNPRYCYHRNAPTASPSGAPLERLRNFEVGNVSISSRGSWDTLVSTST
jgi:hypothetical protein